MAEVLEEKQILEFTYTRSLGEVMSRFHTALRDRKLVGVRGSDGRVIVPPQEHDPQTSESLTEMVDVASEGTVTSWCWNPTPKLGQPFEDRPFAWALVQLDGADTSLLHALDVDGPEAVETGMRVRIRWREQTKGHITDIVCFEPVDAEESAA